MNKYDEIDLDIFYSSSTQYVFCN